MVNHIEMKFQWLLLVFEVQQYNNTLPGILTVSDKTGSHNSKMTAPNRKFLQPPSFSQFTTTQIKRVVNFFEELKIVLLYYQSISFRVGYIIYHRKQTL